MQSFFGVVVGNTFLLEARNHLHLCAEFDVDELRHYALNVPGSTVLHTMLPNTHYVDQVTNIATMYNMKNVVISTSTEVSLCFTITLSIAFLSGLT